MTEDSLATAAARPRVRLAVAVLAAAVAAAAAVPTAQAPPQASATQQPKRFVLKVVTAGESPMTVDLDADRARVRDIADALAVQLGISVTVGKELEAETVSMSMPGSALESVLQSLAPRVVVDYGIRQGRLPTPEAVYLLGPTDLPLPTPPERGPSQGLFITGHTEDGSQDEEPVRVTGDKDGLSISVKTQPLSVVAMAIGEVLGVPVEFVGQGTETIDVEIANTAADDAVTRVSPNLALTVRTDLGQLERRPMRLVVLALEDQVDR